MKDAPAFRHNSTRTTGRGGVAMTTTELTERRELAHRRNDGIDVTLFWSKASNRVTISVFQVM